MSSNQAHEVDDEGTDSPVLHDRSESIETVASLVQRLGSPPQDMAEGLAQQFKNLCVHLERNEPSRVPKTDLYCWCLDHDGVMIALDPEDSFEPLGASEPRPSVADLVSAFQSNLDRPRASQSGKRDSLKSALAESGLHVDGDLGADEHSDAEQARRDKIAALLTTSLIDRFGEDVVEAPEIEEPAPKRPQTIQSDRRFNWNLVLGIGTAAAVVAMMYTGYRLTALRETRVAEQDESVNEVVSSSSSSSSESGAEWRNEDGDNEDGDTVEPLSPSSTSVFSSNKERKTPMDALETLESLNNDRDRSAPKTLKSAFDVSVDPSSLLAIDLPSGVVLPRDDPKTEPKPDQKKDGETQEAAEPSGTLEQVLGGDSDEVPDSPQGIRAADVEFVALPRGQDSETKARVPGLASEFERISFPIDVPIRLDRSENADALAALVSVSDKTNLAIFSADEAGTHFGWTEFAKSDSTAKQVPHGKITTSSGGTIFMRPAIETDPIKLRLGIRDTHPSWDIGWPILPKVSRLEFEIKTPDDVEHAWVEAFDSTQPRRGRAIATITPVDGESVAVAVRLDVRCASKLSCHLRYAARLDPSQPWQPLTRPGLNQITNSLLSQRNSMVTKRQTFEQFYNNADSGQQRMMRRKRDELERTAEQLEATLKRLELLRSLVVMMEDRVHVSMRLFVQWPDGQQQTILTTASASDAKAVKDDEG